MSTATTEGIKVITFPTYESRYSEPNNNQFIFSYKVVISNESEFAVQLLSRHWEIIDTLGETKTVKGDGVVGKQPLLQPGESYTYTSGCPLNSEFGKMKGQYTMERISDHKKFSVDIPEFRLEASYILN